MVTIYCDLETYNEEPIKNGAHRYAETAEITLFSYAYDDQPARVLDFTADDHKAEWSELKARLLKPDTITVWQNGGQFDRVVLSHAKGINLPVERIHDTMVQALSHSLPAGLGVLCEIFNLNDDVAKMKEGKKLINIFCKPRPKNAKLRRATKETHPEDWEKFKEYARLDVESMRILSKKIPNWNYNFEHKEHKLWCLDQKINDRGFFVDVPLVESALDAVEIAKEQLADRTMFLTKGALLSTTQRDATLKYAFEEFGVSLPDLTKATVERRLADPDLPSGLKELLLIRQQAGTTSTSKFEAFKRSVSSRDDRLRGTLQFAGASRTARWAGRNVQPQNFTRPVLSDREVNQAIDALKAGVCHLLFDDLMKVTSSCVRGCIAAAEGKKLVVSDLSNIEGRVATWLTGETWKMQAFSEFDQGKGHDLYKLAYAKSFNVDPATITKDQRTIGKVQELALQYEGGVGAFVTFADGYGIDLDAMADTAYPLIPDDIKRQANSFHGYASTKGNGTFELSEKTFVTCDSLKRMWRQAHPNITQYWHDIKTAVICAIRNTGVEYPCGKVTVVKQGSWLRIMLPYGRSLTYAAPRVNEDGDISYMGMNQYTRKWSRLKTYGGKIFENMCQAVARDVMAESMQPIEDAGYKILLSVHDELITETPDNAKYSESVLSKILATPPSWAMDLPLAAAGFEGKRYKKD
ncbi:DNA polymerase I [Candidatus Pacearchaeota archaeon]|nr:DNA polymerase I [Candidatus Pacearchaeota archaeon]